MSRITQFEDLLHADSDGSYRKQLITMLEAEKKRLQAAAQVGCEPAQYRRYMRQLEAIEHTYTVVNAIWSIYHGSSPSASPIPPTLTNMN